jgi:hypothetical protein
MGVFYYAEIFIFQPIDTNLANITIRIVFIIYFKKEKNETN